MEPKNGMKEEIKDNQWLKHGEQMIAPWARLQML